MSSPSNHTHLTSTNTREILFRPDHYCGITGGGGYTDRIYIENENIVFDRVLVELLFHIPHLYRQDINGLLQIEKSNIIQLIKDKILNDRLISFGFYLTLNIRMIKLNTNTPNEFTNTGITTPRSIISLEDLDTVYINIQKYIDERLENLLNNVEGSGLILDSITELKFCYHRVQIRNVTGYNIQWPLRRCKSLIYSPNNDGYCLITALAAESIQNKLNLNNSNINWNQIHRKLKNPLRLHKFLKFPSLQCSQLEHLQILENRNHININVYKLYENESGEFYLDLIRRSRNLKPHRRVVNLITYTHIDRDHVFLIKSDFQKFIKNFARIHLQPGETVCPFCYQRFFDKVKYIWHKNNHCTTMNSEIKLKYPSPGQVKKFINYIRTEKLRYIQVFDFEAYQKTEFNSDKNSDEKLHKPASFCEVTIDSKYNKIISLTKYIGEDSCTVFLRKSLEIWASLFDKPKYPIHMTLLNKSQHTNATNCDICDRTFSSGIGKVAHHCHSDPGLNFLGSLCSRCNLQIKSTRILTSLAHNSSYDLSLILKYAEPGFEYKALPKKGSMKYYYVLVNDKIKIIDSLNILPNSLQKLISDHLSSGKDLFFTKKVLEAEGFDSSSRIFSLLTSQKGIFPYSYIDDMEKLKETIFPSKKHFFNDLKNQDISDVDYNHAQEVFQLSNAKNLGEYLLTYNLLDVLMLTDVVIVWRNFFFDNYELDVLQYLTINAFTYDSMLFRKSKEDQDFGINLLSDQTLISHISNSVRGGFVTLNESLTHFDNAFTVKDETKRKNLLENIYGLYLDVKMLYGHVMRQPLAIGDVREVLPFEIDLIITKLRDVNFDPINSQYGYWLLVDLDGNSIDLQKLTDRYPFALTKENITKKHISDHTSQLLDKNESSFTFSRLIGHHFKKDNYFLSGENLHMYLKFGVRLTKVHTIYIFKQTPWLRSYIDFNMEKRNKSNNPMENALFKLMNNSVFGKFLCNPKSYAEKHTICTNRNRFCKLLNSENFKRLCILDNKKVIVISRKRFVRMDTPQYIGFQILERSKYHMYFLIYENIYVSLSLYIPRIIYSDTDSIIMSITIKVRDICKNSLCIAYNDFINVMRKISNIIDTSNLNVNNPCYNLLKKSICGVLKNEFPLHYIESFIGLSPKTYSIKLSDFQIRELVSLTKVHFQSLYNCNVLTLVENDIECVILYINNKIVSSDQFLHHFQNINFNLEPYYTSKVFHMSTVKKTPFGKKYYDNEIYNKIKGKDNKDITYFYIEMDKNFDIYIYITMMLIQFLGL